MECAGCRRGWRARPATAEEGGIRCWQFSEPAPIPGAASRRRLPMHIPNTHTICAQIHPLATTQPQHTPANHPDNRPLTPPLTLLPTLPHPETQAAHEHTRPPPISHALPLHRHHTEQPQVHTHTHEHKLTPPTSARSASCCARSSALPADWRPRWMRSAIPSLRGRGRSEGTGLKQVNNLSGRPQRPGLAWMQGPCCQRLGGCS